MIFRTLDDLKAGRKIEEETAVAICYKVREILSEEPNVLKLEAPITVRR